MSEEQYRRARLAFIRSGGRDVDGALLALLRRVAVRFVRHGGLPPVYSPNGRWDADAEEEILADWMAARLVKGQLKAILDEAATPQSFARLAEACLRKHAINRREPSQTANLFNRLRKMLPVDDHLVQMQDAVRDQDKAWGLRSWDEVRVIWTGDERDLASAAWGLGEFATVAYQAGAKRLSHLLEADELTRFVHELLAAVGLPLTLAQIVRALERRFSLEPVVLEDLGDEANDLEAQQPSVSDEVAARQAALAAIGELTPRQVEVLRTQLGNASTRDISAELGVSVGTVSSEQKKISTVLRRISDSEDAGRVVLLNVLREMLFVEQQT
jgi:DNA-binding CsgD family transcriptional regulator